LVVSGSDKAFQVRPLLEMIEQELVGAYFESNGFFVRQLNEPASTEGKRKLDPLPVLSVMNPRSPGNQLSAETRLFTGDLVKIKTALVGVLGWSNSTFSSADLNSDARQTKFFSQQVDAIRVSECFDSVGRKLESGFEAFLKLLVVPCLPSNNERSKKVLDRLKSFQVDGVITLKSIMENLLRQTLPSRNIERREVFNLLRLIKAYGLSKDPQIEMFEESV